MGHGNMDGDQTAGMGSRMMGMGGVDLDTMPKHVQESMRRMMISAPAMHDGMMNEDADVAFACGMIAHHQGAIDMAQVLIKHGQDPRMLAPTEEIIAAQVAEMEQMSTCWLKTPIEPLETRVQALRVTPSGPIETLFCRIGNSRLQ
ncbi:MAG: DUF305 domain-containing protein [Loktanella sp.]|nr:DUF305 domain-containing protein [Loktanella sp.]